MNEQLPLNRHIPLFSEEELNKADQAIEVARNESSSAIGAHAEITPSSAPIASPSAPGAAMQEELARDHAARMVAEEDKADVTNLYR